jgi:hypothetical protein
MLLPCLREGEDGPGPLPGEDGPGIAPVTTSADGGPPCDVLMPLATLGPQEHQGPGAGVWTASRQLNRACCAGRPLVCQECSGGAGMLGVKGRSRGRTQALESTAPEQ